jgi:hypothetical protein
MQIFSPTCTAVSPKQQQQQILAVRKVTSRKSEIPHCTTAIKLTHHWVHPSPDLRHHFTADSTSKPYWLRLSSVHARPRS